MIRTPPRRFAVHEADSSSRNPRCVSCPRSAPLLSFARSHQPVYQVDRRDASRVRALRSQQQLVRVFTADVAEKPCGVRRNTSFHQLCVFSRAGVG